MSKRDINIFSVALLDLLSGALGAVIILYIIIPKIPITVEEFEEQKKLSEEVNKLGVTLDEIKDLIPGEVYDSLSAHIASIEEAKKELEQKIQQVQEQLAECQENNRQAQEKIATLEKQVQELEAQNSQLAEDLKEAQDQIAQAQGLDVDVGFKFKGKNIVFIVDVSGSMEEEDRLGQVTAGIRMLITTMDDKFSVDIVRFPYRTDNDFNALFGQVQVVNQNTKNRVSVYLNRLVAYGGTPTRAVLNYVLNDPGYANVSDIVLLSDGEPTKNRSEDDIFDILQNVRNWNINQRVRINCLGVGSDFLNNTADNKVIFLTQLAAQNGGFFVGF